MQDLGLTASELGSLGSAFFYSFALIQLPLGWALDRFETRLLITIVPLFSTVGLVVFSLADGFAMAYIGRILCGIGMSVVMMGSFKIFSICYAPSHFATLSGLMMSIGTLGNMMAATPLVLLSSTLGWRKTFVIIGILIALLSFTAFWVLRRVNVRCPKTDATATQSSMSFWDGVKLLWGSLTFWQCAGLSFAIYGSFVSLQGLWGGPYLRNIIGFSAIQTGNVLLCLSVGRIVGSTLCGFLSDRVLHSRKLVVIPAAAMFVLMFLGLNGMIPISSLWGNGLLFFAFAGFGAVSVLLYAQLKEMSPAHLTGLASTSLNFFVMFGGAVLTQVIGRIVQRFPQTNGTYPPEAYHTAFWFCLIGTLAALIFYLFSKERRPAQ